MPAARRGAAAREGSKKAWRARLKIGQGRTFDGQILDMIEFHVEELRTVAQISAASKRYASKPCLLFLGEPWEADAVFRPLRNLLLGEQDREKRFDLGVRASR